MKLVRDLIPHIIEEDGKTCKYHVAGTAEFRERLYFKMIEELEEFSEEPSYEEAADMYEVFSEICRLHGLSMEGVEVMADEKREERGGFGARIILEKIDEGREYEYDKTSLKTVPIDREIEDE